MELENENESNSKRAQELEAENEKISAEFHKIQKKYNSEVRDIERENEQLKKILSENGDFAKHNQ